jgi:hypothetical protein
MSLVQEPATCQWKDDSKSCREQRIDNCTSTGLDMEARLLCMISQAGKAYANRTLQDIATDLCGNGELR